MPRKGIPTELTDETIAPADDLHYCPHCGAPLVLRLLPPLLCAPTSFSRRPLTRPPRPTLPPLTPANYNSATQPREELSVTVYKERRQLWLFRGGTLSKIYPVFLGSKPGNKQQRGDNRTPEGDYRVVEKKNVGE